MVLFGHFDLFFFSGRFRPRDELVVDKRSSHLCGQHSPKLSKWTYFQNLHILHRIYNIDCWSLFNLLLFFTIWFLLPLHFLNPKENRDLAVKTFPPKCNELRSSVTRYIYALLVTFDIWQHKSVKCCNGRIEYRKRRKITKLTANMSSSIESKLIGLQSRLAEDTGPPTEPRANGQRRPTMRKYIYCHFIDFIFFLLYLHTFIS